MHQDRIDGRCRAISIVGYLYQLRSMFLVDVLYELSLARFAFHVLNLRPFAVAERAVQRNVPIARGRWRRGRW